MRGRKALTGEAIETALQELDWLPAGVHVAERFDERLLGFIARPPRMLNGLPVVLAFPGCTSVHTCFMRFPIDIAFADKRGRVISLYEGVARWQVRSCPSASFVLERPAVRGPYETPLISA